jgi:Spy/CpxP family protein refolding chaperone
MKMNVMIATVVVGAILGVFAIASAASSGKEHRPGGDRGERLFSKLNLTADQQARIKAIRDQFESDTKSLREQMETLHQQMREARRDDNTAKIEELRTQSEPLRTRMQAAGEKMRQQIASVLTAEQRQQMEQMMAEHKGRCGDHRRGGEGTPEGGAPKGEAPGQPGIE